MCLDLAAALSTGTLQGGTGRCPGSRVEMGWDGQDRTASPGQHHLQDHCRHCITLGFQQRPQERGRPVCLFVVVQHGQCFCPAPCKRRLLRVVSFDGVLQFAAGCLLPKRRINVFTAKKGKLLAPAAKQHPLPSIHVPGAARGAMGEPQSAREGLQWTPHLCCMGVVPPHPWVPESGCRRAG